MRDARARVAAGVVDAAARARAARRPGRPRRAAGSPARDDLDAVELARRAAARSTVPLGRVDLLARDRQQRVDRVGRARSACVDDARAAPSSRSASASGRRARERELGAPAQPGQRRAQLVRDLARRSAARGGATPAMRASRPSSVAARPVSSSRGGPRSKRRSRSCAPQSSALAGHLRDGPQRAVERAADRERRRRAGRARRATSEPSSTSCCRRSSDAIESATTTAPTARAASPGADDRLARSRVSSGPVDARRPRRARPSATAARSSAGEAPGGRSTTRSPSNTQDRRSSTASLGVSRTPTRPWRDVERRELRVGVARAGRSSVSRVDALREQHVADDQQRAEADRERRQRREQQPRRGSSPQHVPDAARGLDRRPARRRRAACGGSARGRRRACCRARSRRPATPAATSAARRTTSPGPGGERRQQAELGRGQRRSRASPWTIAWAAGSSTQPPASRHRGRRRPGAAHERVRRARAARRARTAWSGSRRRRRESR